MLKIRVIGTENEIIWFQSLMKNHLQVRVLEISKSYRNKETNNHYRSYIEIEKKRIDAGIGRAAALHISY